MNRTRLATAAALLAFVSLSALQTPSWSAGANPDKPDLSFQDSGANAQPEPANLRPADPFGRRSALHCITLPIDRSLIEEQGLAAYRSACLPELKSRIGFDDPRYETEFYDLALATVLAHYSAPYGPSSVIDFAGILSEGSLNCSNYGALVGYLAPNAGLSFVGFQGGAVGNHLQLFLQHQDLNVMYDPTIGLIAFVTFDQMLSGKPVAKNKVFSFFSGDPQIVSFNDTVIDAVENGRYRPSDLLYYYESLDHMLHPAGYGPFITPGGVNLRHGAAASRNSSTSDALQQ
jgi:hypothetical protein